MIIDALLDALLDTLKLLPFLFLTYLLIELIEHRAEDKTIALINRAGSWGPAIGSVLGAVPQCGFAAATSNLYAGGLITRGTLLAVFLSTSDEMLPILISSNVPAGFIIKLICYKLLCGMLVGFSVDAVERRFFPRREKRISELCEREGCGCHEGLLRSAIFHTVKIAGFLFVTTLAIGLLVAYFGEDRLALLLTNKPLVGELLAGLVGLIPNCAASVVITQLYLEGGMSAGAMIAGLLVGAGVGMLVLFRMNKNLKENLITLAILYLSGVLLGILAGLTGLF